GWRFIDNFIVALDFAEFNMGGESDPDLGARKGSFFKHVNFGVEIPMKRFFAIRAGFHQGLPTLGLGLNGKYATLDLAWYGEEMGLSLDTLRHQRLALRLAIGLGDW